MSSPSGNWNNPYQNSSRSQPMYPSMIPSIEGGFIPLSFSSPKDQGYKQQSPMNNSRQNWNNSYQRNRNFKQNNYKRGGFDGEPHGSARKYNHNSSNNDDISNYIHPSMLEDPWKELMKQNEEKKKTEEEYADKNMESDTEESNEEGSDENVEKVK